MAQPKVSVLTPVYNGARFLGEAIESVRAQTYANWEYVIVDNCSTDATLAVAREHAARDHRIRIVRMARHLPIMQNWNRALGLIPTDSVYTKELHADDVLMPNCLAEMVALLEEHPSAAFAGSYILYGSAVIHTGVPFGCRLLSGHDAIRKTLRGDWYLFGSPSSIMVRTRLQRALGPAFYDERLRHADVDACYRLLARHDFGFVHQVLSATRTHEGSETSTFEARYSTIALEHLCLFLRYGPEYFDDEAFRDGYRAARRLYRRRFARRLLGGGGAPYWRYHRRQLAAFGYRLGVRDAVMGTLAEIGESIVDGRHGARSLRKALRLIAGNGELRNGCAGTDPRSASTPKTPRRAG